MADVTRTVKIDLDSKDALKDLKKLQKELEETEESAEAMNEEFDSSVDQIEVFGQSVGGLKDSFRGAIQGIRGFVKGLKTVRGALIATGIGAAVVAVGSLIAAMQSFQGVTDAVNKTLTQAKFVINELISRVGLLAKAFALAATGNISGAWDALKESVSGVGSAVLEAADAGAAYADQQVAIEEGNIKLIQQEAELKAEIEQLKRFRDDETNSIEDRIAATRRQGELEQQLEQQRLEQADKRIKQAQIALDQNESDRQLQLELAEAYAERAEIEEDAASRQTEQITNINQLLREQFELIQESTEAQANYIESVLKPATEETKNATDATAEYTSKQNNLNLSFEKQERTAVPTLNSVNDSWALIIGSAEEAASAFGTTFAALANFAEEGTKASKAFAIASAAIDTSLAIIKVWSDAPTGTPFFVKLAQSLFLAAQLKKQADIITATPVPTVSVDSQFADGGLVHGNSHLNGGVKFGVGGRVVELEGGEAVINKRATAIFQPLLSAINASTGGKKFQAGGIIPGNFNDPTTTQLQLEELNRSLQAQQPVLVVQDVTSLQNRIAVTQDRATLG